VLRGGHTATTPSAEQRIAELEAALAASQERVATLAAERDRLREAYQRLKLELDLLKRRIFVAKAERIDTAQLELEFGEKLAALDQLAQRLADDPAPDPAPAAGGAGPSGRTKRPKPTGRRDLREADLPEERLEILDPELEGRYPRIGFEESCKLAWRRPTQVRLIVARAKYRIEEKDGYAIIALAPPEEIIARCLAAPSLLAHVASDKFCDGLPLHRQEDRFERAGFRLDRGTMCRWLEELGGAVGATIVAAMRAEAMAKAFCIATDATGVLVQPIRSGDQVRRPARRGHYLVQIADADHVFFEYLPRETSAAIGELFRGYSGYVLADAKSVYDLLYRPKEPPPDDDGAADPGVRVEVGCWAHARRKFWEAAIAHDAVAREALVRVQRIFDADRALRNRCAAERTELRRLHVRPYVESFLAWAAVEYEAIKDRRGSLRSALGYVVRQEDALARFLEDGRLPLTNNQSERELRRIAVGRKAWLFVGSDDHAQAAGNLLTLIASARLHRLDPETYLRDVFRLLPYWPRDRFLELAPRYWPRVRDVLIPAELAAELGDLHIPPPLDTAAEQKATS
jgi:transposase